MEKVGLQDPVDPVDHVEKQANLDHLGQLDQQVLVGLGDPQALQDREEKLEKVDHQGHQDLVVELENVVNLERLVHQAHLDHGDHLVDVESQVHLGQQVVLDPQDQQENVVDQGPQDLEENEVKLGKQDPLAQQDLGVHLVKEELKEHLDLLDLQVGIKLSNFVSCIFGRYYHHTIIYQGHNKHYENFLLPL